MKKYIYVIFIFFIFFNNTLKADNISDLTSLADEGDAIAQNNLGHYYLYRSEGSAENLDKAIYYLNAAAAQGQVNAMTTVGWTYFTGDHGAPQDNEQAIYWNQRASDAGFTIASYNIGFFLLLWFSGLKTGSLYGKKVLVIKCFSVGKF